MYPIYAIPSSNTLGLVARLLRVVVLSRLKLSSVFQRVERFLGNPETSTADFLLRESLQGRLLHSRAECRLAGKLKESRFWLKRRRGGAFTRNGEATFVRVVVGAFVALGACVGFDPRVRDFERPVTRELLGEVDKRLVVLSFPLTLDDI